ncbi:uncharacterized protein RCC_11428 [Ramularia collo-cygni]|uniref:C3H1-type domain-containing protein n=1 Tax=Ramularia collo-cygni TaxID=112498 RepID=A0A2D3VQS3_9PEZI|nr:uncharacterized protein RCC_11428 [Ramularia collo-cygni]CZT25759.1 uncharacterized protein RCC_11428 [Ramularia collo-cygni]
MQPYPQPHGAGQQRPELQQRQSIDAVANTTRRMNGDRNGNGSTGPLPVGGGNGQRPFGPGMAHRTAASPPKNKNTQHVPCKFFLQGQCQAGGMCPFSHDVESSTRPAPCKYFAKGGCKFGRKCALLHITPDGTVVNRHYPGPPQYLAGAPPHPPPGAYGQPPPPGLLSMQAQGLEQRPNGDGPPHHDLDSYQYGPRNGYDAPQIDMTYTSASPKFGSPNVNDRIATSPPQKGLSVLDAPLPNSFDSNGISWAAKHGPFAASVPSKFDFDSPPSSVPRQPRLGNTALRELHSSAFGDRGMGHVLANMGSSPPSGTDEPLKFEKRPLHSDRLRASRTLMSSSLGARYVPPFEYSDEDDGGDTDREEDLLPSSLHDLIPDSRSRRESRSRASESMEGPASFLAQSRRTISGHGTPSENKMSSSLSSSPSRYTNVFSARGQLSGLGHVGSPLRDSSFPTSHPAFSTSNGELSPSISSPSRQASMSMLTQGLQRTKIETARSTPGSGPGSQQPGAPTRTLSNGSTGRASIDRNVSSNSVSQRIEEEKEEIFDMDIESLPKHTNGASSGFGPIGGQRLK